MGPAAGVGRPWGRRAGNAALREKIREPERERGIPRKAALRQPGIARSGFRCRRSIAADRPPGMRPAPGRPLGYGPCTAKRTAPTASPGSLPSPATTATSGQHKRIARSMRGTGLAGARLRRRHRTTDPAAAKTPRRLGRRGRRVHTWWVSAGDQGRRVRRGVAMSSTARRSSLPDDVNGSSGTN